MIFQNFSQFPFDCEALRIATKSQQSLEVIKLKPLMASCNKVSCRYHPGAVVIEDAHTDDLICSACRLVLGKSDSQGIYLIRCGGLENGLMLKDAGNLTSTICPDTETASSNESAPPKFHNGKKMSYKERKLITAFESISVMSARMNLPKAIVDRAKNMYTKLQNCKRFRTRSIKCKTSACLYLACRQEGAPRSFREISNVSTVSKKKIGRCFRMALKALETKVENITYADFMSRFCDDLELPEEVQRAATHIAKKAKDLNIVPGRSPTSIAAAAIYLASRASEFKNSKKSISDAASVSKTTIHKSYKELFPHAEKLFPENFNFATPFKLLLSNKLYS